MKTKEERIRDRLARRRRWLFSTVPLLGSWLRMRGVKSLAKETQADSSEAVEMLLLLLVEHPDARVRAVAGESLGELCTQQTIDTLCAAWAEERSPQLDQILIEHGYTARNPARVRVLSALKTGKTKAVYPLTPELVTHIAEASFDPDTEISSRAKTVLSSITDEENSQMVREYLRSRQKGAVDWGEQ